MPNPQSNPGPSPKTKSKPAQSKPSLNIKRPRSLFLTLGGALLLIVGGAAGYWLLGGSKLSNIPVGAKVIPQNVLMSLTLTTNTAEWKRLSQLAPSPTRKSWEQGVQDLETQLLQPLDLSYDKHIRPWVGDSLTMAFLVPEGAIAEAVDRQVTVWVLPIRDFERAQDLWKSNQLTQGKPSQSRTYSGVEIRGFQAKDGADYGIAILDQQFMVFTNVGASMDQIIDTYKTTKPSLVQTPRYQEAMGAIQAGAPFAQLYVNLPAAATKMTASGNRQLSEETIDRIKEVQGIGSTVILESDGIRFKSISWLGPDTQQTLEVDNTAKDLANHFPQNTILMISEGDFQQAWRDYALGTPLKLVLPFNPKAWSDNFDQSIGIDFNDEFVPWMDGGFAAALVPAQQNEANNTPKNRNQGLGIALLAKTSDPAAATKALQNLDDKVQQRYAFQITESKIANKTVTSWKVHPGIVVGSHGWLDKNTAFLTLGAPITNRLVPPPKTNLTQAKLFRDTTRSQLQANDGHWFINVPQTLNLTQNSPLLPKLTPNLLRFFRNFEVIGVKSAVNNNWSHRYDIQVKFRKQ